MTQPRFVNCKCGHARALHPERTEEACIATDCGCEEYIPCTLDVNAPQPARITAPAPTRQSVDALIATGRKSSNKRIAALAEKIAEQVKDLAARLAEDEAKATVRSEIADLEAKLAQAKAVLRGDAPLPVVATVAVPVRETSVTVNYGEFPCPDCGQTFTTRQGIGPHRAKVHGYRKEAS